MRIAIIASGLLTGKDARRQMSGVEKRLEEEKIDFDVHIARRHNHAMEIAAGLPLSEYDAVAPMGGDGTNFQVLNGLARSAGPEGPPPLAILPAGRGNSFARDLGIENMDDALSALARGRLRRVDVCRFSQGPEAYYFINLMGVGFVADVARTASRLRWLGTAGYVAGVLYRTASLSFYEMELEIDGEATLEKNCFVEICNSRYTGGDMLMAPEAEIDDGLFDVVIVRPLSRAGLLWTLPKIFKGTHGENPAARFQRAKSLKIRTEVKKALLPDGELFGSTPARVDVMPGMARYFS
ncbi:conserved hypothetical protein [Candidatus Desulfarcum epimagneticum]|uniref:DAGKc domain-containing protein n=1 Tax=uncultured Desulfobacteraceae bacterium TaxID=218296 RepID=A0A484HRE2_9BACT|nr:conserved hypothetical protein [uncultured Desulfobacteraceae bacterium]